MTGRLCVEVVRHARACIQFGRMIASNLDGGLLSEWAGQVEEDKAMGPEAYVVPGPPRQIESCQSGRLGEYRDEF